MLLAERFQRLFYYGHVRKAFRERDVPDGFDMVNGLPVRENIYGGYSAAYPIALVRIVVNIVNAVKIAVYVSGRPEAEPTENAPAV